MTILSLTDLNFEQTTDFIELVNKIIFMHVCQHHDTVNW